MKPDLSILILDDEIVSAMGLKAQLVEAGFRNVVIASSFERAMELYHSIKPEAAIVDINLQSDHTGLDFIREADKLTTIIILSGYGVNLYRDELQTVRYNQFLEKPAPFAAIIEALG